MTCEFTGFPWQGDKLVKPTEVAHYLKTSNQVLESWRHQGFGPNYFWLGGPVLYSLDSVKKFAEQQKTGRHTNRQNTPHYDLLGLME